MKSIKTSRLNKPSESNLHFYWTRKILFLLNPTLPPLSSMCISSFIFFPWLFFFLHPHSVTNSAHTHTVVQCNQLKTSQGQIKVKQTWAASQPARSTFTYTLGCVHPRRANNGSVASVSFNTKVCPNCKEGVRTLFFFVVPRFSFTSAFYACVEEEKRRGCRCRVR